MQHIPSGAKKEGVNMVKKETWKYLAVIFIVAGIVFFAYSFTFNPIASSVTTKSVTLSAWTAPSFTHAERAKRFSFFNILELNPNQLDQKQEILGPPGENTYAIGISSFGPLFIGQEVKNEREPMYGFSVCVGRLNVPTEPLYVGIMIEGLLCPPYLYDLSNWDWVGMITPDILPESGTLYWLTVEFSDPLDIPAEDNFYIVAISEDNNQDGNSWAWGYGGNTDTYPRGYNYYWSEDEWSWLGTTWGDCMFRTYTTESTPQDPPSITVTSTYQVVASFLGSFSLLGAVVSGAKYFMVA